MFEQSLLDRYQTQSRKGWAVLGSLALESLIIGTLILIPLYHLQAIPLKEMQSAFLLAPPPPPPPPPPAAAEARAPKPFVAPVKANLNQLIAPRTIPKQIAMVRDVMNAPPAPPGATGVIGGIPGGVAGGVPGGVPGGVLGSVAKSAPPPPPPPKPVQRIRVSSVEQETKLISQPLPEYPQAAKAANEQGVVRLQAVIGKDGRVKEVQVLSGPPLLVNAAEQAVHQWRYHPTILSGQPVEVSTVIDVNFALHQ